jgi:hypothetical protein
VLSVVEDLICWCLLFEGRSIDVVSSGGGGGEEDGEELLELTKENIKTHVKYL